MAALQGVGIALTNGLLDTALDFTRLDTGTHNPIRSWSIDRGRSYELDKMQTGTCAVQFRDTQGALDPTNGTSPYFGNLDPLKHFGISLQNPCDSTYNTIFKGYVEDFDLSVDVSELFVDGTINCVDAMALLEQAQLAPDNTSSLLPGESYGDTLLINQQVDDRIKGLLRDAGWNDPGDNSVWIIFSGNVEVKAVIYGPGSSILSAIQDAADAEFPGVANFYVNRNGIFVFHGRLARFDYSNPTYGITTWSCGDTIQYTGDPTIIPLFGLTFDRAKTNIYNRGLAYPQDILDQDLVNQPYTTGTATSVTQFGYRWITFENLLTNAGDTGAGPTTDPNTETKKFAQYYVDNYKVARNRIKQLVFRPLHPTHPNAAALWDLMCNVELNDVITVNTNHPGGGGFGENFFVEGIHYEAEPMNDLYPNITLTLDVSPVAAYGTNPFV